MSYAVIVAENTHNFVRAESLRLLSLEMVALIAGAVLLWRCRAGGLVAAYAISLPFSDVVYRLGPLTLSDVLGIVILATRRPRSLGLMAPLIPWLFWGLCMTLWQQPSFFSIAYSLRFVIIFLVAAAIPADRREGEQAVDALTSVTMLAAVIAGLQVVLWRLGFPIDGVFAAGGFVRPKALAHEPSTAAVWFALALPLLAVSTRTHTRSRRLGLLAAIVVGLGLTASLSGFAIVVVFLVIVGSSQLRQFTQRRHLFAAGVVCVTMVGFIVTATYFDQISVLLDKVGNYGSELASGPRPVNVQDVSGREGDLSLLADSPPGWASGSGLFTAPSLAESFEDRTGTYAPASNIVLTTALETGLLGLVLFLGGIFFVTLSVVALFWRQLRAFVAGFLGFEIALLGQRILAFPQPWFMLSIARSLADDEPSSPQGPDLSEAIILDQSTSDLPKEPAP